MTSEKLWHQYVMLTPCLQNRLVYKCRFRQQRQSHEFGLLLVGYLVSMTHWTIYAALARTLIFDLIFIIYGFSMVDLLPVVTQAKKIDTMWTNYFGRSLFYFLWLYIFTKWLSAQFLFFCKINVLTSSLIFR